MGLKQQILDSSKIKILQMTILSLMKMVESYPKRLKTLAEKEQFPFPTVFSKDLYCRHVKTKA